MERGEAYYGVEAGPSKLAALHGSIEQALGHTISENQLRAMTVVFKIYFIAREKAASTSSFKRILPLFQIPDQWLLAPCECVDDGDGDYGANPSCPLHGGEA